MKALKFLVIGMLLFFAGNVHAQIGVTINIGSPPQWGPVGYSEARYYYLPDVEAYYDVPSSMFIYYNGATWVHRTYLPQRYRNYDLYSGYKVVITDYRGNAPYSHFHEHKSKYKKGYRGQSQKTYGERPGNGNSDKREYSKSHSSQKKYHSDKKHSGHSKGKGRKK